MARTKAALGSGVRLSDHLSASLLARVFPAEAVAASLDAHGCNSQRTRSFPATAGVYYCMALSLYPECSYEEVFAALSQGLAWANGSAQPPRVAKSSISALRSRIGFEPLRSLVASCCLPLAEGGRDPHAFYNGLRLVALDGSNFELPDESANASEFGYPGSRTGHAAYPQAQCAVLVECATHAVLSAAIGKYRTVEWALCEELLPALNSSMLCMADRGFRGYARWKAAQATGAQLLWRASTHQILPIQQRLADGSYLSVLTPSQGSRDERRAQAVVVRVIDYSLPDQPGEPSVQTSYRVMTTLLDANAAPALELAALYQQRWQVEQVFDELKTHLMQSKRILRSKTPALVRQEFYGWVLAHYAVRWLLHAGASKARLTHEQLSFKAHVQLLRREQPRSGAFPPSTAQKAQAVV